MEDEEKKCWVWADKSAMQRGLCSSDSEKESEREIAEGGALNGKTLQRNRLWEERKDEEQLWNCVGVKDKVLIRNKKRLDEEWEKAGDSHRGKKVRQQAGRGYQMWGREMNKSEESYSFTKQRGLKEEKEITENEYAQLIR